MGAAPPSPPLSSWHPLFEILDPLLGNTVGHKEAAGFTHD